MGLGTDNGGARKSSGLTPKSILNQKYANTARYRIEEVAASGESSCPGLAIQKAVPCLYRCHLELPGLSVTSDTFTRKKDAEQSAAEIALEKLGCQTVTVNPTPEEAFNELIRRISYLFSNEFLSTSYPLIGHFRAAFMRQDDLYGFVPISVIVSYDTKTINLCKTIDAKAESEPLLMISLVMKAARLTTSVRTLDGALWIGKKTSYSREAVQALLDRHVTSTDCLQIEAICIPSIVEKPIYILTLNVSSDQYYLDEIASILNVRDSSRVLLSRNIGKTSSDMRLFFPVSEFVYPSSSSMDATDAIDGINVVEEPLNKRAAFISGQKIRGNAIMAFVTYKWISPELFYENITLSTFYRTILSRVPTGSYKLSRESVFAAKLPYVFTTRANWRGSLPRDLLGLFCRHHRLSEPVYIEETNGIVELSSKSLKITSQSNPASSTQIGDCERSTVEAQSGASYFRCGVKILSRQNDLIIDYPPGVTYRKQSDAVQNAALKVLSWFNDLFEQLDMHAEKVSFLASSYGINVNSARFLNEFQHCIEYIKGGCMVPVFANKLHGHHQDVIPLFNIEGPDSGNPPSQGSLVCISYAVTLDNGYDHAKEILEGNDNFEFEVGTGAVISQVEACVAQMSVNQCANFMLEAPSRDIVLAAASKHVDTLSQKLPCHCIVKYSIKLLSVTEPLEDRIEQAFFNPPLSKQRVEFAVNFINESSAKTLVDFGCGSGSLLDALLDQTTTLEKVAGVDISRKGLTRAAKVLHSKLNTMSGSMNGSIRTLELYDGSILDSDFRLHGYDIGTCLEVIEHMEEDEASAFGNMVLRAFRPRLLIISTPNYEYNVILKKSNLPNKEEDSDEKSENVPCKFRNHDHKFEWTREQFQRWASMLASSHCYSVEFSGVGGSVDDPGFASQIAVFRQLPSELASDDNSVPVDLSQPYEMIWRWHSGSVCPI